MSAPHITWVFEATHDITHYTSMVTVAAPVDADQDALVSDLADLGYYAIRLDHKEWESWAWPGGYQIFYVVADGGVLCSKCANKEIKLTSDPEIDHQWQIVAADINYEDPGLFCDHCERCESAYGEPDCDDSDDGAALASAGHGTDEDYSHGDMI